MPEHGVYAASMNRRDKGKMYTIAQIQSVHKRMNEIGAFDVVFIDECHLWSGADEGMFQTAVNFLRSHNDKVRIVGLSATPFRMKEGLVYGDGKMFESCVANIGMRELIDAGYLTPLIGKNMDVDLDTSGLHMRGGDFIASELEDFMADRIKVSKAVREIAGQTRDRRKSLVFSTGNKHSQMLVDELLSIGETADWVSGTHSKQERADILARHRSGEIKHLVNCGVLTTGYDDPAIDAIAMVRPTRSPGLLLQCAGRGLRKAEGKDSCLFLDFGGCLAHFGPLDLIEQNVKAKRSAKEAGGAPTKTCPVCQNVVHAAVTFCACGYEWKRKLNHDERASDAQVMSGLVDQRVQRTSYSVNQGHNGNAPCLRVTYWSSIIQEAAREFLSVDATAPRYVRQLALDWLRMTPSHAHEGRTLEVRGNKIVGICNGYEEEITDAISLLKYTKCLASPEFVVTAPNPERPKYTKVYKRKFKA
jgi:DNA repair protein RadD